MGNDYILALDQSTSASKAMVVNKGGEVLTRASLEHKQYYPNPGWVEHDPIEIFENAKKILLEALKQSNLKVNDVCALAITNQRETVLLWDKNTGEPVYNAIVWQCRRSTDICERLKKIGLEEKIREKTGLRLDPYFSATKIKWILENVEGVNDRVSKGEVICGTIDTWILWKLTNGKVHATDFTNASRTLLFNIKTLQWDDELLDVFGIPRCILPEIKSSTDIFGYTDENVFTGIRIPISGIIGDSQGALFGQHCFDPGMVKATYGTGSSVMMNIGDKYKEANNGLVTSIAWGINDKIEYVLEGIIHCTGDALKWIKENLELFENFDEVGLLVSKTASNEGVYLIPAFVGLGIPYWDMNARAAIVGMSRGTNKAHILRAAIESTAYQIRDAVEMMELSSGVRPKELRVDGGPTKDAFLMQFQADILNIQVTTANIAELSSMGSVYLAGLGVGLWKSKEEIKELNREKKVFVPCMQDNVRVHNYNGWKSAVKRVLTY